MGGAPEGDLCVSATCECNSATDYWLHKCDSLLSEGPWGAISSPLGSDYRSGVFETMREPARLLCRPRGNRLSS